MEKPVKILIAKPGLDGHDRGAKVIAQALRDAGMEVIYSGLHKTVEQILEIAIEEDVQVIGLSIMTGAHIPITQRLLEKMREKHIEDKLIFVGGVIPAKDIPILINMGVAGVFPGGVSLGETVRAIKEKVSEI